MNRLLCLFFMLIANVTLAQGNLISNFSFEEYELCPTTGGWVTYGYVAGCNSPYGSVDYFSKCGNSQYNVPLNRFGSEEAHLGNAYVGLATYLNVGATSREYLEIEISQPLIPGKKYYFELYASLMDSALYAISDIGAFFSKNGIGNESINQIFSHQTQVHGVIGNYYDSKHGWQKMSGSFYAQGDEKYVTIGCFIPDSEVDTLYVGNGGTGGSIYTWTFAGYYLDDVRLQLDTATHIEEVDEKSLNIYPNLVRSNENLIYQNVPVTSRLTLYDITGRIIISEYILVEGSGQINITRYKLNSGIYMYQVLDFNNDKCLKSGKLVIR